MIDSDLHGLQWRHLQLPELREAQKALGYHFFFSGGDAQGSAQGITPGAQTCYTQAMACSPFAIYERDVTQLFIATILSRD
jgi:hypothetical protein